VTVSTSPNETAATSEAPPGLDLLAVLAEPNRRRLLELLRGGERTVTELASGFSVTRPAVSQHLGVLAGAGLVEARQDGRFRRYRLVPAGMAALRSTLDAFWTSELEDLASAEPPDLPASPEKGSPHDD
jgi:DNA-binding transcriptional ArsR family regulator